MLKFMPASEKDKWEFKCMCDSDYEGEQRQSFKCDGLLYLH